MARFGDRDSRVFKGRESLRLVIIGLWVGAGNVI